MSIMPRKIVAIPPTSDSHNVIPPDGGAFNSYPGQSMVSFGLACFPKFDHLLS